MLRIALRQESSMFCMRAWRWDGHQETRNEIEGVVAAGVLAAVGPANTIQAKQR